MALFSALVITLIPVGLILIGLLLREAIGRGSDHPCCPKCWYDLTGATGLRCPECGFSAQTPERFRKRRRRSWRYITAMAALLLVTVCLWIAASWFVWPRRMPSALLVRYAPVDSPQAAGLKARQYRELQRRLNMVWTTRASLSRDNSAVLVRRQLEALALSGPLLHTRPRWPRGVPLGLRLENEPVLKTPRSYTLTLHGKQENASDPYVIGPNPFYANPGGPFYWEDPTIVLPLPGSVDSPIDIELRVTEREDSQFGSLIFRTHASIAIGLVDSIDEVIQPVSWGEFTVVDPEEVKISVVDGSRLRSRVEPAVEIEMPRELLETDVALAFRVELKLGEEVVATARLWCGGFTGLSWSDRVWFTVPLEGDVGRLFGVQPGDESWTIIITGGGEMALRDFDRDRYWKGRIVRQGFPDR
ncbi:MAG: hypothetical protein JSV91_04500 [Phycisphaerales bacterium]|nr:MAG: hypothetical protein JSV91_04500 [Phycisphaerales bacterium]